jgi:hypothetical protein
MAFLALVLGCVPALADDTWPPASSPSEDLPAHPGKTYLDLIRMVVPDMTLKDGVYKGGAPVQIRHISGENPELPEETSLNDVSVVPVNSDGKPRLALFFTLGETPGAVESFSVLALYDVTGEPKLLDAAAVGFDRFTYLYAEQKMPVSAGSDVILTMSTHFNSSQGYAITAMILVRGDRLEFIDSLFTLDEKSCTYERMQTTRYESRPGAALFADIEVKVTDTIKLTDDDCGEEPKPEPMSRTVTEIYRWHISEKRYVPDDDKLEKFEAENMERL